MVRPRETENRMPTQDEWRGATGAKWAAEAAVQDRFLDPLGRAGIEALAPEADWRLLDFGCGAGSSSLELAQRASDGGVLGVDISPDLIAAAEARRAERGQANVVFQAADAGARAFPPASFDALFSRFGAMFFDDPAAAYANLRTGLKPGAPLMIVCWRSGPENAAWADRPVQIASEIFGPDLFPPVEDGGSGPFAWSDPAVFEPILTAAGFRDIAWQARDVETEFGDPRIADPMRAAAESELSIGPLARRLKDQPSDIRQRVFTALMEYFAPMVRDGAVRLTGAIWLISARA
jgi:SAM-dependent methyltransferase